MDALTPRINVITLGVSDLERSLAFYRDGLGLKSSGIVGTQYIGDNERPSGAAAMFTLHDGLILSLYGRADLAKDAHVESSRTAGNGISIGHFVDSRDAVDEAISLARRAGAEILGIPHERPWGIYSGYFGDPDGHLWEVIYFPPQAAA